MTRKLARISRIAVILTVMAAIFCISGVIIADNMTTQDFELLNTEVDYTVGNPIVKSRLDGEFRADGAHAQGPYFRYEILEDGTISIYGADYNIYCADGTTRFMTISFDEAGVPYGQTKFQDENSTCEEFCSEKHFIIGNSNLAFMVTEDSIERLKIYDYFKGEPITEERINAMMKVINQVKDILFARSMPQTYYLPSKGEK